MTISTAEIRKIFLTYFKENGHEVVASSPLVPHNDPTLMFTNAGMNQFKNMFTGLETRPYNRAVTSQKCIRAGGKHNDLENVGYTARHHTFFEMLGNFSFGDYFKEQAIEFAWNLMTKKYGLPKEKLCVTVFHEDDEAVTLWKKIAGFSDDKIIRIATSDNFWSMGDTGPCGPCSEIFYDHGAHIPGGPPGSPDEDGDRFVEIWNLVFMQYEKMPDGTMVNLPNPCIDTGMGIERLSAILQGVHNNYDTDIFQDIIMATADKAKANPKSDQITSLRVIADHLRSCSFLVADGVLPSNEGRGYVLRRIMRRAMRHAHILGCKDALMWQLVPTLIEKMGAAYPELGRAEELIKVTLKTEEERFQKTLGTGMRLLEQESTKVADKGTLAGDVAFKLYDTYGFPLDLTQDILRHENKLVDLEGFATCMKIQRDVARAAWSGSGQQKDDDIWFDIREKVGATDFLGYQTESAEGQTMALVQNGKQVSEVTSGDVFVVTNQTPFYGESGGQMGDAGVLISDNAKLEVTDTLKVVGNLHVHKATLLKGSLKAGDALQMYVDGDRRRKLRANHSATHILHEALRRRLGKSVTQKGSLVSPDRLRFDFSYPSALTDEDLRIVEKDVNHQIRMNNEVMTKVMHPDDAVKAGAMALFGEKYGDEVRVVSMGAPEEEKVFSTELCGGTHVARLGDIGFFKIVSESSVSSGVRRIEAVTREAAENLAAENQDILNNLARVLKVSPGQVKSRVEALIEDRKKLEKEIQNARQQAFATGKSAEDDIEEIAGTKVYAKALKGVPAKDLRPMVDALKKKLGSAVILLIAENEDKVAATVGVTEDLLDRFDAKKLITVVSDALGSQGGGGRPDMAQCGGNDASKIDSAIQMFKNNF
tara:strand:+ start:14883 stop:17516 length:2634 start_codon:yes stop_codon:yes gene_type:complete